MSAEKEYFSFSEPFGRCLGLWPGQSQLRWKLGLFVFMFGTTTLLVPQVLLLIFSEFCYMHKYINF